MTTTGFAQRAQSHAVGVEIASLAAGSKNSRGRLNEAAMIHAGLAKDEELLRLALANAANTDMGTRVRTRAQESLRHVEDEAALRLLVKQGSGGNVDLRRAAAVALGESRHKLALPSLMTSFELEKEPLTGGFLAIAIARQGGAQARDFLIHSLETGRKTTRPWCALALGVLSHHSPDERARTALREAAARDRNRNHIGAYLIASAARQDLLQLPARRDRRGV